MVGQVDTLKREHLRKRIAWTFSFRQKCVHASLFGFVIGVSFGSLFSFGFSGALAVLILSLGILAYSRTLSERSLPLLFFWLLFFLAIGMARVAASDRLVERGLDPFVDKRVVLSGVVVREPDIREDTQKITLRVDAVSDRESHEQYLGKVLVSVALYPSVSYGDRIKVTGVLAHPRAFESNGQSGRVFDYPAFLAKDGILYTMDRAGIEVVGHGEGNWLQEKLFAVKRSFVDTISQIFREPYASLLSGLLLGGKQSLGKELLDQFKIVGLIHIVVLSGYNITLIGDAMLKVFSFLPRIFSMSLGVGSIILFALMTGSGATVVRATVMALIALFARSNGRIYDMTRALLVAGFLMVLHNPHILLFDASFQLSFLATLGLIVLSPVFTEKLSFITDRFKFREIVASTLATQLFVLPLILYNTGALSLLALPANLLVLPTIPATMLFGFLATVLAFVSPIIALPLSAVASVLLHYQVGLVRVVSDLPFASVSIPTFPFFVLILMYVVLLFVVLRMQKGLKTGLEKWLT
ncbi:MAG: ComEC/Rec2 family competence protein [Patescibacteria group bacterium]